MDRLYQVPLQRALAHALAHLHGVDDVPVAATTTLAGLRARLGHPLDPMGVDPAQVIDELAAESAGGILGSAGGRFFGWVIGGATPAALAADWLTAAWDQNAALAGTAPAEAVIEEIGGMWLKELLGLPPDASFAFVTGSQMGHVTCLAATSATGQSSALCGSLASAAPRWSIYQRTTKAGCAVAC